MKKLYTKLAGSDLKFSRFPFIKVLSLTSIAALLSSISPALSKELDSGEGISANIRNTAGIYPQSVISVYDESRSNLGSFNGSKNNYIRMLHTARTSQVNALSGYKNFLTRTLTEVGNKNSLANTLKIDSNKLSKNTLSSEDQYKKFIVDPQFFMDSRSTTRSVTQSGQDRVAIDASDFSRKDHIASMTRSGEVQRDVSGHNVIFGEEVNAQTTDSVVLGYKAQAVLDEKDKKLAASVIIGSKSEIHRGGSVAVGADIVSLKNDAVAVGRFVRVEEESGTALGFKTQVKAAGGVALGSDSVSDRVAGEFGYTSLLQGPAQNTEVQWKSTRGAVSVGDYSKGITRQITGVAAGSNVTDAVNLRQLKDLEQVVRQNGWKLSVGDKNATTVLMDSGVDFSAGSANLNITKGEDDNKLKFDLAQDVTLTSLKAGTNTLDATGLVITDGPKITTSGIDAGNKRVMSIASGDLSADSQDAVNGSQLNVVATHIAGYLGGGVKFTNGQWDDPKFTIKTFNPEKNEIEEESFSNVAKAFEGVGKSYVNLHNEIKKAADDSVFKWNAELESIKIAASEEESGQGSIAIGIGSKTKGDAGIALGKLSNASGENSIALGGFSAASAENSIALGGLSSASAENSIALGLNAQVQADVTGGVAVGYKSFSRNSASAVGYDPSIDGKSADDGVIWKSTQGAFSVGDTPNKITRQLTGVAAGYADTDAVNIAQLKKLREFVAQGWTLSLNDKAVSDFQPGDKLNLASGSDNLKIKSSDKKDSISKEITFDLAQDVTLNSVKLKDVTLDTTGLTIENGPKVIADGIDAAGKKITGLAGGDLSASSTDAVNGGQLHTLTDDLSKILGGDVSFDGKNFKGPEYKLSNIDENGEVTDKSHTNVGSAFKGLDDNIKNVNARIKEVEKDISSNSLNWDGSVGDGGAYNAAHGEKDASKIVNVADGKVEKDSHETITGSQLYALGDKVAEYFGGDATYENGVLNKPTFKLKIFNSENNEVEEKSYNNVAEAFDGIDKNFQSVNKNVQNIVNDFKEEVTNITESVQGDALLWDDKAQSFVAKHGEKDGEKENSKITSLAAGSIISASSDAINGDQLHTVTEDLSKILGGDVSFDGKNFKGPEYKLSNIDEKGEVTDKPHSDVGSAFKGLDDNIKNVNARIKEVSEGVAQDSLSWSDSDKAFVAQHGAGDDRKASKITSLAVGDITKESTDAVNGSQLYSLGDKVAKYFSDDAEYKDGELKVPDFKLKTINDDGTEAESSYKNVSDAFSGVGQLFTKVQNAISDVISNLLVTKNEDVINIGKGVEGSEINIANKSGKDRTLSGVKAAEKNNEAVNKEQLDKGLKDLSDTLLSDSSSVVLYDKTTDDQIDYTNVTFGKGKDATPVALHNVAAGLIAENSTDVINGGQVHILSTDVAKFLGGDAEFKDGAFKGPTYNLSSIDKNGEVTDKPHTDIGSAFKGLDENIKTVNDRIKEVSEGVAQDSLSWSDGDKAFVALHGEGEDRRASKITSLAAGSIVSGSSDAVNGGQIYDLNQSLAKYFGGDAKYNGDGWVLPGFKIMTFQEDGSFEEEDYDSIAAAFAGVNKVVKNLHNEISDNIEQNALLWSDDAGAFVAQHEKEGKKENSKITFLAEGEILKDSTDAINGGQIYTIQQTFASYFGGGAGYDKDGSWQGPKFHVQVFNKDGTKGDKEERNSVSEAFDVVNDSMSTINDRIKEVEKDASSNSLNWNEEKGSYDASHVDSQGVKSPSKIINVENGKVDKDSKEAVNGGQLWETQQMITDQVKDIENKVTEGSVQYDKDKKTGKKTNKVTLVGGDDSSPVLIDNVADGKIEKDSKEAVNGGQLKDKMDFVLESANKYTDEKVSHLVKDGVSEANSYTDMKFSTLSYAVEDVRKEARQAAAVGLAVAGLRYSDIPGKLTIAFGSGLWRSQSAFAFGAGYTSENGDIGSNLSITTSGGHWGISTGVNWILN
ncbi:MULTISPECIES: YadA-like family protein [unclassified Bartonella]|uniref:YadA-like family protein n=1 Tax=unclassified Bartonella TaxID=2645622 RepID=UPI0035CE86AD